MNISSNICKYSTFILVLGGSSIAYSSNGRPPYKEYGFVSNPYGFSYNLEQSSTFNTPIAASQSTTPVYIDLIKNSEENTPLSFNSIVALLINKNPDVSNDVRKQKIERLRAYYSPDAVNYDGIRQYLDINTKSKEQQETEEKMAKLVTMQNEMKLLLSQADELIASDKLSISDKQALQDFLGYLVGLKLTGNKRKFDESSITQHPPKRIRTSPPQDDYSNNFTLRQKHGNPSKSEDKEYNWMTCKNCESRVLRKNCSTHKCPSESYKN